MVEKLKKRRRIYSLEPSKIAQAEFARIYLSHLVPALMKLKQNKKSDIADTSKDDDGRGGLIKSSCVNVVKREVGMAMVWSAPPGFAWTKALKAKLQPAEDQTNAVAAIINDDHHHHIDSPSSQYFSANPTGNNEDDRDEEEGFKRLRRLIPGGEEIGEGEEMVKELGSYIRCLQMQVNILQCLAHTP
ncbi:transcription factor bHLH146-like [Prosopis cineraria]|uniref:transcription factor bHLH146-like n=1 Tax=Prosopis cineraria TaxID=364024 RepID=UPI002410B199|nr:transcription factor bHLH146-like [Prosopis cineraria]